MGAALLLGKSTPVRTQQVQENAPAQVIIGGEAFPDNLTRPDLADRGLTNEDIAGLCNMKRLTFLSLNGNPITDLSCIAGLTDMESVHFNDTDVSDIGFVQGMDKLRSISGECTQVSDLSPLEDKTLLESVFFGDSLVTDISPLSGCYFTELYVNYNELSGGECFDGISVINYLALDHSGLTHDDLLYILRSVNGTYRYQYTYDPDDPYYGEERARFDDLLELEDKTS